MVATVAKEDDSVTLASLGGRSANALLKRAEQLKRWEESETNKEAVSSKLEGNRKVKFPEGCVFLAACAASDLNDIERLLSDGADINTTNVDGLTALHQAVIDENQDVVRFLVDHGADVNAQDNEGWTSLHAAVSCGFADVSKFLIEHGADVAVPNNDGELPIDLAETEELGLLLNEAIEQQCVDLEMARRREEQRMLEDATHWLQGKVPFEKWLRHPKNGATPLHVAAAKGYVKVMSILLQAGHPVDIQDIDGWSPLHAAAHWSDRQACELLVEHMANMELKNTAGQTCFDVSDEAMVKYLKELQVRQSQLEKKKQENAENKTTSDSTDPSLKQRRNSITRYSGPRKNIAKVDEVTEAKIRRSSASSSDASDVSDTEMTSASANSAVRSPLKPRNRDDPVQNNSSDMKDIQGLSTANNTIVLSIGGATADTTETAEVSKPNKNFSTDVVVTSENPQKRPAGLQDTSSKMPKLTDSLCASAAMASSSLNSLSSSSTTSTSVASATVVTVSALSSNSSKDPSCQFRTTDSSQQQVPTSLVPSAISLDNNTASPNKSLSTKVATTLMETASSPLALPSVAKARSPLPDWRVTGRVGLRRVEPGSLGVSPAKESAGDTAPLNEFSKVRLRAPPAASVVQAETTPENAKRGTVSSVVHDAQSHCSSQTLRAQCKRSSTVTFGSAATSTTRSIEFAQKRALSESGAAYSVNDAGDRRPTWMQTATTQLNEIKFSNIKDATLNRAGCEEMFNVASSSQRFCSVTSSSIKSNDLTTVNSNTKSDHHTTTKADPPRNQSRLFAQPKRDDESESERKAHARRQRETRRSTQGITADDLRSITGTGGPSVIKNDVMSVELEGGPIAASESSSNATPKQPKQCELQTEAPSTTASSRLTPSKMFSTASVGWSKSQTGSDIEQNSLSSRVSNGSEDTTSSSVAGRYAWRTRAAADKSEMASATTLRVTSANNSTITASTTRPQTLLTATTIQASTSSTTGASSDADADSMSSGLKTSRQRRQRNARRSTGPVASEDLAEAADNIDVDHELCNEEGMPASEKDVTTISCNSATTTMPTTQSVSKSAYISNLVGVSNNNAPTSSLAGYNRPAYGTSRAQSASSRGSSVASVTSFNDDEIDYKKLYEEANSENKVLRHKLKQLEEETEELRKHATTTVTTKSQMNGITISSAGSLTDKERRALERKLAEYEEEVKQIEQLRADNQRLKDENGALIRVISKLSK